MKKEEKEKAIELRHSGSSISEIANQLGVSQGSVSLWTKGVILTPEQRSRFPSERTEAGERFFGLPVDDIEGMIREGLSQKGMAERCGVSASLVSRVFKMHGMAGRTIRGHYPVPLEPVCKICKKDRGDKLWGSVCNTCNSKIRRFAMKIRLIRERGGKCEKCGWVPEKEEIVAMEFHHKENNKEFTIGRKLNHKWDTLISEVRKCKLLCSRCHRILHSRTDYILEHSFRLADAMTER